MQIDEAIRQATAPDTEGGGRISPLAELGAEVGTAADGQTKAEGLRQMEAVVERSNLWQAYERVLRNKGAAGVDGLTVSELKAWLQQHWPSVKAALLAGDYLPAAIRKVEMPKPNGGVRILGIPTVLDRLIQQALLQVLQPEFEPEFSEHSYGFRPGRNAWQAVQRAQGYIREERRWVVDLDLEKFFDRVNHDLLMSRVARRVKDERVLKLIRRYLEAGMMSEGMVSARTEGTPQGGPLTPRTQEITSSSSGKFPCIVPKQHLICVAGGNMLKAHVARHRFRKGTTGEQRLRSACSWSQPQRGRASIDRVIRVVASSGLSLPAGGTGTCAAAAGCPTDHSRHDQNPRRGRGGVARVCPRKRPDDGRDCRVRGIGVSGQGTPTWLIGAGRVMTCIWTMFLTACSPPSLSKSTRSWYRIGHAARGGRPG